MVTRLAANFNGITMAYAMGLVNALLGVLIAFGVTITDQQAAAIIGFVNAAMIVAAHVGHRLGEQSPTQHPGAQAPAAPEAATTSTGG